MENRESELELASKQIREFPSFMSYYKHLENAKVLVRADSKVSTMAINTERNLVKIFPKGKETSSDKFIGVEKVFDRNQSNDNMVENAPLINFEKAQSFYKEQLKNELSNIPTNYAKVESNPSEDIQGNIQYLQSEVEKKVTQNLKEIESYEKLDKPVQEAVEEITNQKPYDEFLASVEGQEPPVEHVDLVSAVFNEDTKQTTNVVDYDKAKEKYDEQLNEKNKEVLNKLEVVLEDPKQEVPASLKKAAYSVVKNVAVNKHVEATKMANHLESNTFISDEVKDFNEKAVQEVVEKSEYKKVTVEQLEELAEMAAEKTRGIIEEYLNEFVDNQAFEATMTTNLPSRTEVHGRYHKSFKERLGEFKVNVKDKLATVASIPEKTALNVKEITSNFVADKMLSVSNKLKDASFKLDQKYDTKTYGEKFADAYELSSNSRLVEPVNEFHARGTLLGDREDIGLKPPTAVIKGFGDNKKGPVKQQKNVLER